jgi:hypothetical protein
MRLLSPNHHGRHLSNEEDIIDFSRTAPIETREYWDLADAVHAPQPDPRAVEAAKVAVLAELGGRNDDTVLNQTSENFKRVIDQQM